MGGRGSFIDVDNNDFAFREGGQTYFSVGTIGNNIKILERPRYSVKAPEYSHTENRIYVILQNGKLKHIAFYNEKHELIKSIDFMHQHDNLQPHVHHDVNHVEGTVSKPNSEEQNVINLVNQWLKRR